MNRQERDVCFAAGCIILVSAALATLVLGGCKKDAGESGKSGDSEQTGSAVEVAAEPNAEAAGEVETTRTQTAGVAEEPETTEEDVIRSARGWGPAYESWLGKAAPDFTLRDLDGKEHKLSDHRGKDVMLVFWATWCPPCMMEIPHLIALRNRVGEDKLAILAITNEGADRIAPFAERKRINYTVLLEQGNMPAPFGVMRIYRTSGVPCSFFIRPDGTIKLGTVGLLNLGYMKAIVQSEWAERNF